MILNRRNDQLYIIGVREHSISDGSSKLTFYTTRGDLRAYARIRHGMRRAVIMLGGDDGENGYDSEFELLSREFADLGIGSVRVEYRFPGDCAQCVIDALLVCQYLDDEGITDIAYVGWSFGAEVALEAGSVARIARGVVAISPCEVPDICIRRMSRKHLLLIHGDADEVYPIENINHIRMRAGGDTDMMTYAGAGHDLTGVRRQIDADIIDWIIHTLEPVQTQKQISSTNAPLLK